jgi:NADP-dependent aldehyde dehydrogenase
MLIPRRGAAIVFGASNFPLAYGVLGGDTIGAMATGLGVVVKEHPAHRRTGQLLAKLARRALEETGHRGSLLGYAEDDDDGSRAVARALVLHEVACAVGFTGSKAGGSKGLPASGSGPFPSLPRWAAPTRSSSRLARLPPGARRSRASLAARC